MRLFITLYLLLAINVLFAQTKPVTDYINELKADKDLKGAIISIKVLNAEGAAIVSHNSGILLNPASLQKIVTTGVALSVLGKNYKYTTELAYNGSINDSVLNGNVYIIGFGDPTLGSDKFETTATDTIFSKFASALRDKGIHTINGSIIPVYDFFKDGYLSEERINPSWEYDDSGYSYAAGASGLNFCENKFNITLNTQTGFNNGFYPTCDYPYYNRLRYDVVMSDKTDLNVHISPYDSIYFIKGHLSNSKSENTLECALLDPPETCALSFNDYLINNGFKVKKEQLEHGNKNTICTISSPEYYKIASVTNAYSNNVFANVAFKTVSKTISGKSQYSDASVVYCSILNKLESAKNIRISDGCGLSRRNLLSANFMCDYLVYIKKEIPDFDKYLPAPGEKGTLRYFMSGYKSKSKARLKSGTITGAVNYAGYVKNKQGRVQYVTVMVNNYTSKSSVVRKKLEKLIHLISEI